MVKCKRLVFAWVFFFSPKSIALIPPPPKNPIFNTLIGQEQPGLVEDVLSHGRRVVERDYLYEPFQTIHDSVINKSPSEPLDTVKIPAELARPGAR